MKILGLNVREVAKRLQIDRIVVYGVVANLWLLFSGFVTLLLIIKYFSAELQGYYYTFNTIIALKVFVETGFNAVVVSFSSHEWSKLHINEQGYIVGDSVALSRLISLARIVFKWYFTGGFIVLVGLGLGGYFFFSSEQSSIIVNWQLPWILMCVSTMLNMWLMPALFLLEGCNQVKQIYSYRLMQGICVSLFTWTAIILGAELWAALLSAVSATLCLYIYILLRYRNFFKPMISYHVTASINWRTDLMPMQWRIALSWISGYFVSSFFTPLIFHYQGAVAAGQFGMSWMLFSAIGTLSSMWFAPKVPQFGMLIAKKDYFALDKLFFKSSRMAIGLFLIGAVLVWAGIMIINSVNYTFLTNLAHRVISPLASGILLIGMFVVFSTSPFVSYLRAHNKEPTFAGNVIYAFIIAIIAWILVNRYSILGVSIAYTTVAVLLAFPYVFIVWSRSREKWHLL